MNLFMAIIIISRLFLKKSGLPSEVDAAWIALNSIVTNRVNRDLSLPLKRTRKEWETMSTPDVVSLADEPVHTADEPPARKTAKILNFCPQQIKICMQKQNLVSAVIANSQNIGQETGTN